MTDNLISIGEVAKRLGVSIDTLRRWDKAHRLMAIRSGLRGYRRYRQSDIDLFLRNESILAKQWASAVVGVTPLDDVYCPTRDIFQARLEKLQYTLEKIVPDSARYLLCAIA